MMTQGEEWVWYPTGHDFATYSPDADQTFVLLDPVPCEWCGKECKPGQDQCWECLGEQIPPPDEVWYVFGRDAVQQHTHSYQTIPVMSTSTLPANYIYTATSSLMITGVSIQGNSWTISPAINVISGDSISFQINGTITW